MSGTDVTLTDLLEQQLAATLEAMAGPVIGRVEAYDAVNARVSIKPLVPLKVDGEIIVAPVLPSVPVAWPGSGTHSDRWPIALGAYMELAPLGHDHDEWMTSGVANLPPKTERRFSLADLVAKPLSPSPLATPPNPLSYDATHRVLFGPCKFGDNTATKPVGLNGDVCPAVTLMATWMGQVEVAVNALSAPATPVNPLSTTFAGTAIANLTGTGTDMKGK